jgi:hypothetical protein
VPEWFRPETDTFRVWAEREAGSCKPEWTPYPSTERTEADGKTCTWHQERCSASQTVTLPAVVSVACTKARAAKRHRRHR